jgi:hypothetical protein
VQNAIDTSRHREFHERAKGREQFQAESIQLRSWEDDTGHVWVRIDDYGMGMNEQMVLKYLLKVGTSYYKSSEFEADVLRYRNRMSEDFVPISRFGIGLLSCFIACDRLELSTRRVDEDESELRMSMHGLRGFFVLHQKGEYHRPEPMPQPRGETESHYRSRSGTSIAVRLDAKKDVSGFDLGAILDQYVLHPPVRVDFGAQQVGRDYRRVIETPCAEVSIPFSEDQIRLARATLGQGELRPVIRVVPLDLTANSGTPLLKGQGVLVYVDGIPRGNSRLIHISFAPTTNRSRILSIQGSKYGPGLELKVECEAFSNSPRTFGWLSHNGIHVPTGESLSIKSPVADAELFVQVALRDRFRPDLSVARDQINGLSWECLSTLALTIYKCLRMAGVTDFSNHILYDHLQKGGNDLGELKKRLPNIEAWENEPIIQISQDAFVSLNDLRLMIEGDFELPLATNPLPVGDRVFSTASFLNCISAALLQLGVGLHIRVTPDFKGQLVVSSRTPKTHDGQLLFPPLFFVPYRDSVLLRIGNAPINLSHPFSRWWIDTARHLKSKHPGIFEGLRRNTSFGQWSSSAELPRLVAKSLNDILARLRRLEPSIVSPALVLTAEDIRVHASA